MISIFDFKEYPQFLRKYLAEQPKQGHGSLSKWASELRVSTTLMSQIVSGKKPMSLEVAIGLAIVIGLAEKETDYLVLLVEWEHAGTRTLKDYIYKRIETAQAASRMLKNRIEQVEELSDEAKARYYSSWIYAAIRNFIATEPEISHDALADRLGITRPRATEALEFLQEQALIERTKNGWKIGARSLYLTSDSPLVIKHHNNWRIKGMQKMDNRDESEMFFTSPMSLSENAATQLRKKLVDVIQEVRKIAGDSDAETVRCLNIDWFKY